MISTIRPIMAVRPKSFGVKTSATRALEPGAVRLGDDAADDDRDVGQPGRASGRGTSG